jgi:hypothetical protein
VSDADLWAAVKAEPGRTPAALALAAVAHYADTAAEQAEWLADTYPGVPAHRHAQVAVREAVGRTRIAAVIGVPFGLAGLSMRTWAHARLVLDVAAVFGRDPGSPDRAAELLMLLGVYPDLDAARDAVAGVLDPDREAADLPAPSGSFAALAGARAVRHLVARFIPGSALVLDGLATAAGTDDLAARVIRFYR